MPKMGESVMEGTIISWLKQPGDAVEADEPLLEIATDKVDTEVPSPHGGVIKKLLVQKGAVVPVGQPIALLEVSNQTQPTAPRTVEPPKQPVEAATPVRVAKAVAAKPSDTRFYSPLIRSIAKKEGITPSTLATIPGTGQAGRLTKKDVLSYLKTPAVAPPTKADPEDEIIEMDRMRQIIATRMLESVRISPHVTSFVEADITRAMNWKRKVKQAFYAKENEAITLTHIFIHATARALQDFPLINISVSGTHIIRHKAIHIGVAMALPTGNLIVPVVHHADRLNIRGLVLRVNDLARRARAGQLKPDELAGGTYTISNMGTFGNVMGTPIILQPQCAVLAFGLVGKRPVVLTDDSGQDMIAIRQMMHLSHSYDHRVIDGALGGMFVRRVADYIEEDPPDYGGA